MSIDIEMLTPGDVGRWVNYHRLVGHRTKYEYGRIKSWNEKWIFVVYKCDDNWDMFEDYTGCATDPDNLTFADREEAIEDYKHLDDADYIDGGM